MEDSGIVEEMEAGRREPSVQGHERTGWEAVVFLVEEIGTAEAPVLDESLAMDDSL